MPGGSPSGSHLATSAHPERISEKSGLAGVPAISAALCGDRALIVGTADPDLARLGALRLRENDPQNPVLEGRLSGLSINREGQSHRTADLTTPEFVEIPGRALRLFGVGHILDRTAERNGVLMDSEIELVRLHTRDRRYDDRLIP